MEAIDTFPRLHDAWARLDESPRRGKEMMEWTRTSGR